MDGNMFSGMGKAFIRILILNTILFVLFLFFLINWLKGTSIKSTDPIIPEIELIIDEDNKVDTIYFYKKK